ncbi:MAG: response regulator [Acidobacteria bacterium]|nr:response regulator [Acidobacteriota bacterium]
MKVLVIDDEQDIRLIAQMGLRTAGVDAQVAASGPDGIRLARDWRPDAILLDVMMPEMDGYATFAALREDGDTASIPVIFLTAKNSNGLDAQAQSEGAAGFINKPFSPRDLASQIRTALGL